MYRIEFTGGAREGRVLLLMESLANQHQTEPDVTLISEDGLAVPTHRALLALQSKFLTRLISSLPCCTKNSSISVPFNGNVLRNLLAVIGSGLSLGLNKKDLLGVQYAADLLQIPLGHLEVQKTNKQVVQVDLDGSSSVKSLFNQAVQRTIAMETPENSPKPYDQNDDIIDDENNYENEDFANEEEEVVEITPEIFSHESEEDGGYPAHFLMQSVEEGESFNSSWMEDEAWAEDSSKKPELIEIDGEEAGAEKKYKCSFCPNKVFKKKPEVIRHFKKHIPLSQRKRFQCDKCREKFISNSNLKTHTKVCTGVAKTLVCKRCKAVFDNKTDYESHLAEAHNTGRNHECHICHKQLRRAGDVKKHMLTHSEGKPFVCDLCGKRFRTESYVKVHRQVHLTGSPKKKVNLDMGEKTKESQDILAVTAGSRKVIAESMESRKVFGDTEESQEGLVNPVERLECLDYAEGSQGSTADTEEEGHEGFADTEDERREAVNDNHLVIDQNGALEGSPSSEQDHITIDGQGWMESEDDYRYEESNKNYLETNDSVDDVYNNMHAKDEEEMDNYTDFETVGKGFSRVHNNQFGNSNERVI